MRREWMTKSNQVEREAPAGEEGFFVYACRRSGVSYVNRSRRAGVPHEAAIRLVNDASDLIHQIYQRERVEDVMRWRDAVVSQPELGMNMKAQS
jgi:hypothetical protein